MARDASAAFERADFPEAVRVMDRHFGSSNYSLKTLFRDEQRKLLGLILESTLEETAAVYRQIYENHAPLMRFIGDLGVPLPRVLRTTAEFVLNGSLRRLLREGEPDAERARTLLDAARREGVPLDGRGLSFELGRTLDRLMKRVRATPQDLGPLALVGSLVGLAGTRPFEVDLSGVQDLYWELLQEVYPELQGAADDESRAWAAAFVALGSQLGVRVEPDEAPDPAPSPPSV
jgi:hypothetical protein